MLKKSIERGTLHGITFDETEATLAQQFYSDNTSIMIRATQEDAKECEQVFNQFGRVSGLRVNWEETSAILILEEPCPDDLREFWWKWEAPGSFSKLLGYTFGDGFD
jgi:hypothetical protein